MLRFLSLLRRSVWRAVQHDAFFHAKGAAYSSVLTLFPALLVVASVLALSNQTEAFLREISYAIGVIMPPGTRSTALRYFEGKQHFPLRILLLASFLTLFAASGVMTAWMEGFRKAYQLPKIWSLWKEEAVAVALVLLAFVPLTFATLLVGFGKQIENWMFFQGGELLGFYIVLFWSGMRWTIACLTSVAVITIIYHFGVPRRLPWRHSLPGAVLATVLWLSATVVFAWYVQRFATYNIIYGSLGTAIALLVWMYLISLVVLIGAEFNALLHPRPVPAQHPKAQPAMEHEPPAEAREHSRVSG